MDLQSPPLKQVQNPAQLVEMLSDLYGATKALMQAIEGFAPALTVQLSHATGLAGFSRKSSIAGTSSARDPELLKIDVDKRQAVPVPPESRAYLATLKVLEKQRIAHRQSLGGSPSNENQ